MVGAMRATTALLAIVVAATACTAEDTSSTTAPEPTSSTTAAVTTVITQADQPDGPRRGFSLSPQAFTEDGINRFMELSVQGGTLLEWVGDGFEWHPDTPGGPRIVQTLAEEHGLEPITVGGWARTEDGSLIRPLTEENVTTYVEAARAFAVAHQPTYMGFGVEIDTHHREAPEHWEDSTDLFAQVARAIHEASPDTMVFTVFQLERLRGMRGGLFGGENDESQNDWDLVDDFPDADFFAFSTYPGLVFEHPSDIPDDYYSSIFDHIDGPIAITETGWQAGSELGPYSGTPERQAAYVTRLHELLDGLDIAFFTWAWLFDQQIGPPFEFMALFDADGNARPGWEAWLEAG